MVLASQKSRGFSVVELMITLVVLAILASVALPAYRDSVRKSGRTGAKGALMDLVLRQEQYFLNNRSYSGTLEGLGLPDPYYVNKSASTVAASDGARVYQITLANLSATSFDAIATAVSDQTKDTCGNYTLTSDGTRSVSGSAGSAACW